MSVYRLVTRVVNSSCAVNNQQIYNSAFWFNRNLTLGSIFSCEVVEAEQLSAKEIAKRAANDRTKVIPVETSIRYLNSEAYKQTYGEYLIWEQYRRNHKGSLAPRKTRRTCIRAGLISTGNPCPICRDEYLVLDHHNVELLKQFISPHTGEVLSYRKTGLCQKRHNQLLIAVERAIDYGLLTFDVPFREYDYAEYYKPDAKLSS